MAFRQYVAMSCDFCGHADYFSGKNIKYAKDYWSKIGGIFFKEKSFCSEKCKESHIKEQNGEIDTGLDSGPPNSIIKYEKLYIPQQKDLTDGN